MIIAFSCKQRGLQSFVWSKTGGCDLGNISTRMYSWKIPHRHVVFTIPKRFRQFFVHNRSLNGILFQSSWRSLKSAHRILGKESSFRQFGAVMSLRTGGETLNHHPHIHALVSDGVFDETDNLQPIVWDSKVLLLWKILMPS